MSDPPLLYSFPLWSVCIGGQRRRRRNWQEQKWDCLFGGGGGVFFRMQVLEWFVFLSSLACKIVQTNIYMPSHIVFLRGVSAAPKSWKFSQKSAVGYTYSTFKNETKSPFHFAKTKLFAFCFHTANGAKVFLVFPTAGVAFRELEGAREGLGDFVGCPFNSMSMNDEPSLFWIGIDSQAGEKRHECKKVI